MGWGFVSVAPSLLPLEGGRERRLGAAQRRNIRGASYLMRRTLNLEPDNLISFIVNDESHEDEVFVTDILDAVAVAVFAEGGIARFHFIGGVVVGVEAFA